MPLTTQALYFHLGLNADDDGIVEAFSVLRSIGCNEDDLKILVTKGFVTVLNEDLVSYILDWQENNRIRPDRKIDSIYQSLLLSIKPNVELVKKRPRSGKTTTNGQQMDNKWTTNGQPMDGIGKDSIVEDSIVEDSIVEGSIELSADAPAPPPKAEKKFIPPTIEEVKAYCQETGKLIDAESFINYYTSNGWKVGRNAMKDWKAAVRQWRKRDEANGKVYNPNPVPSYNINKMEQAMVAKYKTE